MQQIRMSLRGKAVVLMGKNTMMRKAIRGHLENNPALEKWVTLSECAPGYSVWERGCCLRSRPEGCRLSFRLLPHIRGNVGFVFTKEDLTEIRDMLLANKVGEISPHCASGLADRELKIKLSIFGVPA